MLDTLILTPGTPEAGTETLKPEIRAVSYTHLRAHET